MNFIDLNQRFTHEKLLEFVEYIRGIQKQIGFKVSSRGWGYLLEQNGLINKDQFDKVENLINKCRKNGYLPVDFVAEEAARDFKEVHEPNTDEPTEWFSKWFGYLKDCHKWYSPDWWDGEEYYVQMIVEKIDLVTLFQPVCRDFHIPIANSKGWSSILQRAEYTRRFKEAEDRGLKCVLLYCGDHDPDGLRISDTLRKNLRDVQDVYWRDGETGYDPSDLIIERFGLNYDFIRDNDLTWIDNLITGSGRNLASPSHKNYRMEYVQQYLSEVGERKCEANALVVAPEEGRKLCQKAIESYLGSDALSRFKAKKKAKEQELLDWREELGIEEPIQEIQDALDYDQN